ncbi:TetR/AcrR family transcriptional regulator C-terminal domain-containing protein [Rhodococcus opacus]|nr:TetR/AcrR family transcriptional regulator C-terminal domain-containing protein [Rhodococcus opacus]
MFSAVIEDSATRVADSQTDMIDRHLGEVNDLEPDLVALGREWVTIPTRDFADHFAMGRQINAEAAHFPQAALDAWQEAGPRRVQHALADAFARLDASGLLRVGDPRRAAHHFALLMGAEISEARSTAPFPSAPTRCRPSSPTGSRPSSTATSARELIRRWARARAERTAC